MFWAGILLGSSGFILTHRFRHRVDRDGREQLARAMRKLRDAFTRVPSPDDDLLLTGRLISSLQGGQSLDSALESAAVEAAPALRARINVLLAGRTQPDFLSSFLRSALDSGMPSLEALKNMEKALRSRRKLALRARAVSGNCRAQAEVLSWLPWALAAALLLVDGDWLLGACKQPFSWILWAVAVVLSGLGRAWIRRSVSNTLRPRGVNEILEEQILPDFILRVIAEVSQGIDVETSTERALARASHAPLSTAFAGGACGPVVTRLRSTLRHAARTGAPVREELTALLQDLQAELESRWEERVQRLPITLLGPLFACFFPSSMLVLAGFLVPIFRLSL